MECVCVKNSVYVLKATASILAVQLMTSDPWGQDGTCFPELMMMRINNLHMYTDLKHTFIIFKIKNCDFFFLDNFELHKFDFGNKGTIVTMSIRE